MKLCKGEVKEVVAQRIKSGAKKRERTVKSFGYEVTVKKDAGVRGDQCMV